MRLRYRLILVFLALTFALVFLTGAQAHRILSRQSTLLEERKTQLLDALAKEQSLNREVIARYLEKAQSDSLRAIKTAQVGLILEDILVFLVVAGVGVWLATWITSPLERMAEDASRALRVVQDMPVEEGLTVVASEAESATRKPRLFARKEENLLSRALNILEKTVQNQSARLETRLWDRAEGLREFSDQLSNIEKIFYDLPENPEINRMLREIAQRICEQLGFYRIKIYLVDDSGQYVELKAMAGGGFTESETLDQATSAPEIPTQGVRLRVRQGENDQKGGLSVNEIPGYVAATGEIYQSAIIQQGGVTAQNPDVPPSNLEIALPLSIYDKTIGVIDLLSARSAELVDYEIAMLRLLADQLALVVENARLQDQIRQAQEVEQSIYREITRQAWDEVMRGRSEIGYLSEEKGVFQAKGEWRPWMIRAIQDGRVVVWQEGGFSIASVPIRVRDYVLGVLDFRRAGEGARWTSEELALVQTLTDQLGQALESARLYQHTQMRAERERVLTEITSKVRASTNVNVILQTAIKELAEALHVPKGTIQLRNVGGGELERRYGSAGGGQSDA